MIGDRQRRENPDMNKGCGVNVFSIVEEDAGPAMRRSMHVLQFAVGLVLLIACANDESAAGAGDSSRTGDLHPDGDRLSAGPHCPAAAESILLSVLAGIAGLLVAVWCISGISALAPEDASRLRELRLEPLVLAYTFIVALLTGLIFGAAPALHCAHQNERRCGVYVWHRCPVAAYCSWAAISVRRNPIQISGPSKIFPWRSNRARWWASSGATAPARPPC